MFDTQNRVSESTLRELTNMIQASAGFIWREFEFFVRRAILPSSVFFILLFIVDNLYNDGKLFNQLYKIFNSHSSSLFIFFSVLIILLSTNYILKLLSQILFDNFLKVDFTPIVTILPHQKKEKKDFLKLRSKVIEKLKTNNPLFEDLNYNDHILYQILGKLLDKQLTDKYATDTKRYATDAKEGGVIIVSIIAILIWYSMLQYDTLKDECCLGGVPIAITLLWLIGLCYVRGKYRSRAYRLYINYLLMDKNENQSNTEIEQNQSAFNVG